MTMSSEQSNTSRSQLLQDLELSHEQYQRLVEDVRQFCDSRDRVMERTTDLLDSAETLELGSPPFVLDDGETCYAYASADGSASALPYGYQLDDEDIELADDAPIFCVPSPSSTASGVIRLIPVSKAFDVPGDDAFALEYQLTNEVSMFDFEGLTARNDIYSDAESGNLYTGRAVLHWPDGSLRKEANFVDGMLDDKMTWWYENGQKELEDTYVENMRHGTHHAWHDNGQLMCQGESIHGERQGSWLWWHDNGQLAEETVYLDNEPVSKSTFWYDSGAKKLTTSYQDGLEHGTQTTWFENGQRHTEMEMEDGVANGVVTFWYESGAKAGVVHAADNEKHGREQIWDEAGQLIAETNWSYGEEVN
jgi:antitoxin component YwqK of YwqJK toxin-antitoxin module